MPELRLVGWPIWLSVSLHVAGLATASSVVALARHEPERVLIPVELVRVEPPAPVEKPKMPQQITRPSPVARPALTRQTLMQDETPRTERTPDPAAASPERRYMASAEVPGPALPIPGPAGDGGLLLPAAEIPGARYVSLPSANHLMLEEEPAWSQLLEELGLFLNW